MTTRPDMQEDERRPRLTPSTPMLADTCHNGHAFLTTARWLYPCRHCGGDPMAVRQNPCIRGENTPGAVQEKTLQVLLRIELLLQQLNEAHGKTP